MRVSVSIRTMCLVSALALLAGCGGSGSSTVATATSPTTTSVKSAPQLSISGAAPTTASAGQPYSFTPHVSGGSGTVKFTIQNAPSWAGFNASNGVLSGTPQTADVGTYSNVTITATDSQGSTSSLAPFTITVAQSGSGTGNVSLNWTAPTTNTDGSVVTDLLGYKIYYGTSASALTNVVTVTGAVTTYVIEGLTSGTWYFAVRSFTSIGTESALSNIVSKSVT